MLLLSLIEKNTANISTCTYKTANRFPTGSVFTKDHFLTSDVPTRRDKEIIYFRYRLIK